MSKEDLASLKIGLSSQYQGVLENLDSKLSNKKILMEKIKKETDEMNKHDEHSPEYQAHIKKQQEYIFELENTKPSIMEKAIKFFENPIVRAVLMALFSILSFWIMKKVTGQEKEEEQEPEEKDFQQNQNGYYQNYPPPPPYYYPPNYQQGNYNNQRH